MDDSEPKSVGDKKAAALRHKEELEELKISQPDFYKFLQENDAELLNFNPEEVEEDDEENEDQDDEMLERNEVQENMQDILVSGLSKSEVTQWQKQIMEVR
jgi:nucleolar complex protein 2